MLNESTQPGSDRIRYLPYKIDVALDVIERIGKSIEPSFILTPSAREVYIKLIQYFHADPEFNGDLSRGLLLMGPSGTGKTLAMKVMQKYRKIDEIQFIKNHKLCPLIFDINHVNDVASSFITDGIDGLRYFCTRYVICLDDIGAEIPAVKHYGNDLDVIAHVISERQARGLLTFGTTNYPADVLEKKYDDRTVSRIYGLFNFIEMVDKDFRRT